MTRNNVLAFWLGLAMTLAVVGLHEVGGFTRWERLSIDYRFQALPRSAPPMTDQIVNIDIDDTALSVVGRWPWDRSKLADAVNELVAAGAKTIALDLLLSDEQQYPEGTQRTIDHDGLFADAIARGRCVLAVDVKTQDDFEKVWEGDRGRIELESILDVLGRDIEMEIDEAIDRARLTGERKAFFREKAALLRRVAASRAYREAPDPPRTVDEFERLVAPEMAEAQGDYPERQILATVLEQATAWNSVQPHLLPADPTGSFADDARIADFDTAPLPQFCDGAAGFGFVNASTQTHPDGVVREMTMRMPAPGGVSLQFGLSAAMVHMGIEPSAIDLTASRIDLGEVELPLRDTRLWLAWPSLSARPRLFDGLGMDDEAAGARRMSLGVPVLLARARRVHEENVGKLEALTHRILLERRLRSLWREWGDPLRAENRARASAVVSFVLEGAADAAAIEEIREWIRADGELTEERRREELTTVDEAARWLEIDTALAGSSADAVDAATRAEFARLSRSFVEKNQRKEFDSFPDPLDTYLAEAQAEVKAMLATAAGEAEDAATTHHRANCALFPTILKNVEDGTVAVRKRSADLAARVGGKLAFVGWTATGAAADFFSTAQRPRTPGVDVHATIAHMAMTGDAMRFLSLGFETGIVFLAGLLCTLAAVRFSTLPSALVAGIVLVAYLVIAGVGTFQIRNELLPVVAPATAGLTSWIAVTALQAALVQRDRQRIERQFKARVSAQLVDHLVTNPGAITVGGEEREMTTVFVDLAGFTTVAETLGGAATVSTLNRYMGRLTDVLIEQGAYVNKFLGDGVMAFWSAFALDSEQATRGCIAALRCQQAVQEINAQPGFENTPKIGMRVGVATGKVVVGDCGAPPALNDYTVIGDAVNLAARLESANKQFGTGILINGRTQELLDRDAPVRLRRLGNIIVVGQNVAVPVFEVLGPDASDELITLTERAVDAYAAGEFERCLAALAELEEKHDQKKLVGLYRAAIDIVDDDFDGSLRLDSK